MHTERPFIIEEDELDDADAEATSNNSNTEGDSLEATLCPSLITLSSSEDSLRDNDNPKGDSIEEKLYSAFVGQRYTTPASSRDPFLRRSKELLKE